MRILRYWLRSLSPSEYYTKNGFAWVSLSQTTKEIETTKGCHYNNFLEEVWLYNKVFLLWSISVYNSKQLIKSEYDKKFISWNIGLRGAGMSVPSVFQVTKAYANFYNVLVNMTNPTVKVLNVKFPIRLWENWKSLKWVLLHDPYRLTTLYWHLYFIINLLNGIWRKFSV